MEKKFRINDGGKKLLIDLLAEKNITSASDKFAYFYKNLLQSMPTVLEPGKPLDGEKKPDHLRRVFVACFDRCFSALQKESDESWVNQVLTEEEENPAPAPPKKQSLSDTVSDSITDTKVPRTVRQPYA